jgi:predicted membrane channel-forming protein YqfA (hemolysin III family)
MSGDDGPEHLWLRLAAMGAAIAAALAVFALFITGAWYRWGLFGVLIAIAVAAIVAGWIHDRRHPPYRPDA